MVVTVGMFEGVFITVPCPKCNYEMDIELISVRLQETTFCPCCKVSIQLRDSEASLFGSQEEIESAFNDLKQELKKLNMTINFTV